MTLRETELAHVRAVQAEFQADLEGGGLDPEATVNCRKAIFACEDRIAELERPADPPGEAPAV